MCLRGNAQQVLGELSVGELEDFDVIRAALERRFDPAERESLKRVEFRSRFKKKGESVTEYGFVLNRLAASAYPNMPSEVRKTIVIDQFVSGLPSKDLRRHVQFNHPSSIQEAVALASEFESFDEKVESRKPENAEAVRSIGVARRVTLRGVPTLTRGGGTSVGRKLADTDQRNVFVPASKKEKGIEVPRCLVEAEGADLFVPVTNIKEVEAEAGGSAWSADVEVERKEDGFPENPECVAKGKRVRSVVRILIFYENVGSTASTSGHYTSAVITEKIDNRQVCEFNLSLGRLESEFVLACKQVTEMEATATSSPSSFKLALVSCLIFLGLLACCSGVMKSKEFKVSCQSYYLKNTLGAITCEVNSEMLKYQCQYTSQRLLQVKVSKDIISKCVKTSVADLRDCKGKEPSNGAFNCEEKGNIVKFNCHFIPTESDQGREASCVLQCDNRTRDVVYRFLITETCLLKIGEPKKEQDSNFSLMALLIALAIAGVTVLVAWLIWKNCLQGEKEGDSEPKAEGEMMAEGIQQEQESRV